mmetsp:Transcript_23940/g.94200  ORF Transcript_23940/g.94200 Transcript_23940/m.94200 type:complete len:105 (+) Transcript_23940:3075-3389(+)
MLFQPLPKELPKRIKKRSRNSFSFLGLDSHSTGLQSPWLSEENMFDRKLQSRVFRFRSLARDARALKAFTSGCGNKHRIFRKQTACIALTLYRLGLYLARSSRL